MIAKLVYSPHADKKKNTYVIRIELPVLEANQASYPALIK